MAAVDESILNKETSADSLLMMKIEPTTNESKKRLRTHASEDSSSVDMSLLHGLLGANEAEVIKDDTLRKEHSLGSESLLGKDLGKLSFSSSGLLDHFPSFSTTELHHNSSNTMMRDESLTGDAIPRDDSINLEAILRENSQPPLKRAKYDHDVVETSAAVLAGASSVGAGVSGSGGASLSATTALSTGGAAGRPVMATTVRNLADIQTNFLFDSVLSGGASSGRSKAKMDFTTAGSPPSGMAGSSVSDTTTSAGNGGGSHKFTSLSNRGGYKCGRCGQPKKGHVCTYTAGGGAVESKETRTFACQVEIDKTMTVEVMKQDPDWRVKGYNAYMEAREMRRVARLGNAGAGARGDGGSGSSDNGVGADAAGEDGEEGDGDSGDEADVDEEA